MEPKSKLPKIHIKYLHLAMVVLLLLLIVVVFWRGVVAPTLPSTTTPPANPYDNLGPIDQVMHTDNTKVQFANFTAELPPKWSLVAQLNSPSGTALRCIVDGCKLALIGPVDDSAQLLEIILSTTSSVKPLLETPDLTYEDLKVPFLGREMTLRAYRQTIYKISVDEQGNEQTLGQETSGILQVDGCDPTTNACFFALMNPSSGVNELQLAELLEFISSLKIIPN